MIDQRANPGPELVTCSSRPKAAPGRVRIHYKHEIEQARFGHHGLGAVRRYGGRVAQVSDALTGATRSEEGVIVVSALSPPAAVAIVR